MMPVNQIISHSYQEREIRLPIEIIPQNICKFYHSAGNVSRRISNYPKLRIMFFILITKWRLALPELLAT